MNFWTAFWITIVMGIASFIAVKLGHRDIKALISIIGALAVATPILVIYISGMMGMYQVSETEEVGRIASATIDSLFTWLGNNIESIVAGDFAGAVLGAVFGYRAVS